MDETLNIPPLSQTLDSLAPKALIFYRRHRTNVQMKTDV